MNEDLSNTSYFAFGKRFSTKGYSISEHSLNVFFASLEDDVLSKFAIACLALTITPAARRALTVLLNQPTTMLNYPIFAPTFHGDVAAVKKLLKKDATLIAVREAKNLTPLHVAASRGQSDVAQLLIDHLSDLAAATSVYEQLSKEIVPTHPLSRVRRQQSHIVKTLTYPDWLPTLPEYRVSRETTMQN